MESRVPRHVDVEAAYRRIEGQVRRTPIVDVGHLPGVDARVVVKLEHLQHTGSFKPRGALNAVLSLGSAASGVCAASGGNHAAAVAWAARRAGLTADVFVPKSATPAKIARIEEYGARIHLVDGFVKEALTACAEFSDREAIPQLHPFDTFETVCGAGTVGIEIGEQQPEASYVLLGCGGGGLYAGVATALAARGTLVQPVEPERCPALAEAIAAGGPVEVSVGGIAADSLGAPRIGTIAYDVARRHDVAPVLVTEEEIVAARRFLWRSLRILAEPGACVALAALLAGHVVVPADETALVVVSGANNESWP